MLKCEINRTTVTNGIYSNVRRQMEFSNLFNYENEMFEVKDETSDYQEVIDSINQSFGEELVVKFSSQPIFAVADPSDTLVNKYLTSSIFKEEVASASPDELLSPKQQALFSRLQKMGLISIDTHTIGGKVYYKIPGTTSVDSVERLKSFIRDNKIDFLNVIEGDTTLIQVGQVQSEPDTFMTIPQSKPVSITKNRILKFLKNIGFNNIQEVNELIYKGQPIKGSAYVDFLDGVMQIVEGKEDYALPEEAMHILVTLIKQSRPELYNRMYADVINYKIYRDVVNDPDYTTNPLYLIEGKLNYGKVREEAIAKLMAEFLVDGLQSTHETGRRIEQTLNWWQQFVQWIREKFGAYKNPFKEALDSINEDDTTFGEFADISSDDIFLSAKSVDQIDRENPDNKSSWENIKNRPSALKVYKVDNDYFKDGEKIDESKRVSADVDKYYTKLFGKRNFDSDLEEFYEQSRQDGSYLHEIFEEVLNSWIDPQTGLMRRNPTSTIFPLDGNPLQGKIVKDLQAYLKRFMAMYPEGTRFLVEQIIYDEKIDKYGTVDFMAILPDSTVDVIDWKSVLLQDLQGVKDYKKGAIFVQLNEYARILKEDYDVEKIGRIRAIPVKKNYKTNKDTKVRSLVGIEIGNADPSKIESDKKYLRPVISPEESTGSDVRDEIVKKLEALYQKYIDKGYFQTDRTILNDVQEAIYEIRVSDTVDNLSSYFTDLVTKFRQFFPEAETLLNGKKDDISEALSLISFYQDIIKNVVDPSFYLFEDVTIAKESRAKLQSAAGQLSVLSRKMDQIREKLLDSLAKKDGVFDLLKPEKIVGLARRWFRSMGSQDIASVRYMYELVKKAFNRIDLDTDNDLKGLKELKFGFDGWRKKKGVTVKEATGMLVDFQNGKIHSKISQDFFKEREKLLEERNPQAIIKFVVDNYNLDEYRQWYNDTLAENKKIWEASTYDQDEKKNKQIIRSKITTFEKNYNIFTSPVTAFGFHNPKVWGKNIKEEKWYSDKYKELLKDENKALLDMYNFMVDKNKYLSSIGAIKDYQQYTFLPNIRKTFADVMSFEDTSTLSKVRDVSINHYNNWRKSLSVDDYQLNYQGARDPFTGEKLEKRFIPFIQELDTNEQSFDIFTIYGLMSKEINKEKYLSENDEILRSLLHLEKMKPNLLQNKFGKVSSTGNKLDVSKETGKNAPILEEHIRAIVNGESLQYDSDFVFKVQLKLKDKWNKTPLGKLYKFDVSPESYTPTNISATKFLLWLNTVNQKRVLGLNAASAISNLFGGTYAGNRLYKKYMNENDINKAWGKMTSGAFYSTPEMKKNAALVDYFLPLLNNRESFKSSQLSVSNTAQILSQEWLMTPMRKTSEIVQLNIFLAIVENSGIVNGKLTNLKDMAAQELNYYNRYDLAPQERKDLEKKLQDKLKDYKSKYGLVKLSQFKTIKEAGKDKVVLEIPGVDRNGEDVKVLRDIVQTMSKDALGEADEFDIANYRYSIWWRLFMTFKNWIPRQADVRFGEFRYDQAHQSHEYGRFRMFARALSANYVQSITKIIPIPYLTGKLTNAAFSKEALIKRGKEVYDMKMDEAKKMGKYDPRTFISQGEFVDKFVQGTDATFAEVRTIILMNLLLFLGLAASDGDDDSEEKAFKSLMRRQIDKLSDEVGFFYSPKSGIDIAGGGAPMFSLIRDTWYLGTNVAKQFFGYSLEELGWDEKGIKMQQQAKPIKRFFKVIPVLKEILTYLPAVDEETAKDWGVRVTDRRGF